MAVIGVNVVSGLKFQVSSSLRPLRSLRETGFY